MAIKIPTRNYLTFSELQERWTCSESDLRFAIISAELKASVRLIGKHNVQTWEIDHFGDWVASDYAPGDFGYGLEIEPRGWQYLQDPIQTESFDCEFTLATDDRDADKGEFPFALWLKLHNPIRIEKIKETAVFLLEEIARYEAKYGDESAYQKPSKQMDKRERTSYLNIIGAMLAQLTAGKANDTTVITEAVTTYGTKYGISVRKLQEVFAAAKRSLGAS